MKIIKNQTPYIGKIFLKFEKFPEYSGQTFLNKIHLNLGFTKLVSRIRPERHDDGLGSKKVDPEKKSLIEKYTGGKIVDYRLDNTEHTDEFILEDSFVSADGEYIGSIRDGWRYYKNRLIVSEKYPIGVAIKVKKDFFKSSGPIKKHIESYSDEFIEGFYGYTHRGGSIFKIGDRIFDESYYPRMEDYEKDEWIAYRNELEKRILGDLNNLGIAETTSLASIMPFNRRGKKIIETWDEAEFAAEKLSKYLS